MKANDVLHSKVTRNNHMLASGLDKDYQGQKHCVQLEVHACIIDVVLPKHLSIDQLLLVSAAGNGL